MNFKNNLNLNLAKSQKRSNIFIWSDSSDLNELVLFFIKATFFTEYNFMAVLL